MAFFNLILSSRSVMGSRSMSTATCLINAPSPETTTTQRRGAPRSRPYDVFINHRGADTRHTVARLLYDRLLQLSGGRVRPFLDNKSMRPGDRLVGRIDEGIRECKVAVAIFSKRYLDSAFCLHELASLVEAVAESGDLASCDIERFRAALRQARYTVGLTYDPSTGDLADLVSAAANAVMQRIEETESTR
ncbi:unnamed protein product [Urochloa decumbens]|uniref:TIR domain-containing protein n=1 Tax=Urochloa decumbens TaxID=240449 RepID=A0ABC9F1A3_9POAL